MKLDKYLVHDVYHVISNLEAIHGRAQKEEIIRNVLLMGERKDMIYTREQVEQVLRHFTVINMIAEHEGFYRVY